MFCPGVASRQDQGRLFQAQKVICLVDVAVQVVVAVVADEVVRYWDACSQAHCVLDIEFLWTNRRQRMRQQTLISNATYSLRDGRSVLLVRPAVDADAGEVRRGMDIRAILFEEVLEVRVMCIVAEEARHSE